MAFGPYVPMCIASLITLVRRPVLSYQEPVELVPASSSGEGL